MIAYGKFNESLTVGYFEMDFKVWTLYEPIKMHRPHVHTLDIYFL